MAAVALIIMLSGGQAFHFRLARLVARRPVVPLALLVVSAVWLGRKANRSATLAELARIYNSIERAALPLAFLLAVATFWTGMRWGSFVAGGSDSYGYVSQAHLWAAGDGLIAVRPLPNAPFPDADWVLSPLGYRPGPVPGTIVPSYPSGYPLLMALAIRLAGSQAAFVVVPLLGAIGVLFTFLIGRKLGDAVSGLLASAWLATHPVFLRQIMQPMSDAPAMTAVLLAIWFALRPDKHAPFLSGCIAAGAMLIRPNLILLAAPIVLLFWFSRSPESWSPVRRLAAFAVGLLPGVILLGAIQH
ncbi:MAG: glycosyltransferase family 39 protein, partial [Vicinamibacteria bacterium]|nr:glycosyltransferase family 39 protein [Vicinamibacteria bacterium]